MNTYEYIGNRLKEIRMKLDKSQVDFSEMLGVAQSTYSAYELGKKMPSTEFIIDICKKTNTSADWILGIENKQNLKCTEGDLIEMILALEECGVQVFQSRVDYSVFDLTNVKEKVESIETLFLLVNANGFSQLWPSLVNMRELSNKGTFPNEIINTWLHAEIEKQKDFPIQPYSSSLVYRVKEVVSGLQKDDNSLPFEL